MKKIKAEVIKRKSTKAKLTEILDRNNGSDMFLITNELKLTIWNMIFHKKKILQDIETNYVIISNEKHKLVQELRGILKK